MGKCSINKMSQSRKLPSSNKINKIKIAALAI